MCTSVCIWESKVQLFKFRYVGCFPKDLGVCFLVFICFGCFWVKAAFAVVVVFVDSGEMRSLSLIDLWQLFGLTYLIGFTSGYLESIGLFFHLFFQMNWNILP
jgi:hypothetical protein